MKTKVAVLLAGALVALLLLSRYFALTRAGLPLGWMLYLGLPITAAGVLFALRLINLGAGWATKDVKHDVGAAARPISLSSLPQASASERLKELEALHAEGAISDSYPERAVGELQAAAASLVVPGPPGQIDQLTDIDEPGHLTEDPFQDRASRTPRPRDVDDRRAGAGRPGPGDLSITVR